MNGPSKFARYGCMYSNLGYATSRKKYEDSIASFRQALGLTRNFLSTPHRAVVPFCRIARLATAVGSTSCWPSPSPTPVISTAAYLSAQAKEEGYGSMNDLKTDPSFSAMLNFRKRKRFLRPSPPTRSCIVDLHCRLRRAARCPYPCGKRYSRSVTILSMNRTFALFACLAVCAASGVQAIAAPQSASSRAAVVPGPQEFPGVSIRK